MYRQSMNINPSFDTTNLSILLLETTVDLVREWLMWLPRYCVELHHGVVESRFASELPRIRCPDYYVCMACSIDDTELLAKVLWNPHRK